jgi:hypothetical protein
MAVAKRKAGRVDITTLTASTGVIAGTGTPVASVNDELVGREARRACGEPRTRPYCSR